jgi:HD domain
MLALRNAPARARRLVTADRIQALSRALREEFSAPFFFYDGSTGELLDDRDAAESPASARGEIPAEILAIAARRRPHVGLGGTEHFRLALPFQESDGSLLVAIGDLPALARSSHASRMEQARLQKWLQLVHSRLSSSGEATAMHRVDQPHLQQHRVDQPHLQQLKSLLEASRELTDLLAGLRSLGESSTDQARILRRVAAVLPVETLIWVSPQGEETVAIEGDRRLSARDARELARWLSKSPGWDPSGCLILNHAPSCGLGARYSGIVNLMALSVDNKDAGGWLIALNKRDAAAAPDRSPGRAGPETGIERPATSPHPPRSDSPAIIPFRSIDVAILKPFASLLGLQSRSERRQTQVQELFAGLVRSLTAAIDAKDSYTCGHSERVARVAVELGRELGLSESELGDVYLAGLLHDIGKIGVPDSLLGKRGPLTPDEFLQVSQHVLIGCRILEGFGGVSHLLPSVLAHHERYDGTGYPHGLKGESIPLLARILAVADCYDAMSTARPYRPALARDRIEENLARGRDLQWDGAVIDAFFRARERIDSIHPRGVGDSVWFALNDPAERISPAYLADDRFSMT